MQEKKEGCKTIYNNKYSCHLELIKIYNKKKIFHNFFILKKLSVLKNHPKNIVFRNHSKHLNKLKLLHLNNKKHAKTTMLVILPT